MKEQKSMLKFFLITVPITLVLLGVFVVLLVILGQQAPSVLIFIGFVVLLIVVSIVYGIYKFAEWVNKIE